MPQSAADTGMVDHVVPIEDMPALLVDYQQHLGVAAERKDGSGTRADVRQHLGRDYHCCTASIMISVATRKAP